MVKLSINSLGGSLCQYMFYRVELSLFDIFLASLFISIYVPDLGSNTLKYNCSNSLMPISSLNFFIYPASVLALSLSCKENSQHFVVVG